MIAVTVADYNVLDSAPGTEQLSQSSWRSFFFCTVNFTSSTTCILLRVFKSSATAQEELVRTQRRRLSLSSRRLLMCPLIALTTSHAHTRGGAAYGEPVRDRSEPAKNQESQFLSSVWRLFSPFLDGGRRGLPFKYVWRLAFNFFCDQLSIFQSPTTGIFLWSPIASW